MIIESKLDPRGTSSGGITDPLTGRIEKLLLATESFPKDDPEGALTALFKAIPNEDITTFLEGTTREVVVALMVLTLGIQAIYQGENYGEWLVSNVDTSKFEEHQESLLQILLMERLEREGRITYVSGFRYNPFTNGEDVIYNVPKAT